MKRIKASTLFIFGSLVATIALDAAWTARRLTKNSGISSNPSIAVNAANVYIAYMDSTPGNHEIYFKMSTNGGATWQAAKRLTNNAGYSWAPRLAVSGAAIHVVWADNTPGNDEIYYRRSKDNGSTWQAAKRLTHTAEFSFYPDIAVNAANVYVTWCDGLAGAGGKKFTIYFRQSPDNGASWQAAKKLTTGTSDARNPVMAARQATIFMAWSEDMEYSESEIFFRKSTDGGETWRPAKRLTDDAGYSFNPDIAVKGSNVYIVWCDNTPMKDWEICFIQSADSGATWQAVEWLTNNSGNSEGPAVAASATARYVAWGDDTPGNLEIYTKYSPN